MLRKVDPKLRMLFDQMPGAWGCKDENSNFMYGNAEYARIIGLRNHLDVIGRSDFDMPCETVNCAEMFQKQNMQPFVNPKKLAMIETRRKRMCEPFRNYC